MEKGKFENPKARQGVKIGKSTNDFWSEIRRVVPSKNLDVSKRNGDNHLGLNRSILGMVTPENLEHLVKIVNLANKYLVPLYPISAGKNIGYGSIAPVADGQLVVNLGRLNRILDYDAESGEVTVEPGVTQKQLSDFLKEKGGEFIADMTGASPQASIIGNTLEGGFGHTPLGDHRNEIVSCEILLGSGKLLQSGEYPNIGPNLVGLFIQSNFGIMTKLRIPLLKVPEQILSFVLKFKDHQSFDNALVPLRNLRRDGVISSLLHIANSTRVLMTNKTFPEDLPSSKVLSEEDCLGMLNRGPIKVGMWTAVGGLYGSKAEVKLKLKTLKKALKPYCQIITFSDEKIRGLKWVTNNTPIKRTSLGKSIAESVDSVESMHGLLKGTPTNRPSENILWREKSMEDLGLMWMCPIVNINESEVNELRILASKVFEKYKFELPITLTMINSKKMIAIINLSFNRNNQSEVKRAQKAYAELSSLLEKSGFSSYRLGVFKAKSYQYEKIKQSVLDDIGISLDPNNIIAPGRYGISK